MNNTTSVASKGSGATSSVFVWARVAFVWRSCGFVWAPDLPEFYKIMICFFIARIIATAGENLATAGENSRYGWREAVGGAGIHAGARRHDASTLKCHENLNLFSTYVSGL